MMQLAPATVVSACESSSHLPNVTFDVAFENVLELEMRRRDVVN
jgi:hypothetical protein